MPLYRNILSRKIDNKSGNDPPKTDNSNASLKLLQDHLLSKRRQQQQSSAQKVHKPAERSHEVKESALHRASGDEWDLEDEYNPLFPNNYEVLKAEHLKAEEQRQTVKKSSSKIIPNLLDVIDQFDELDEQLSDSKKVKGISIAPPPSLNKNISNDALETVGPMLPTTKTLAAQQGEKLDGSSVAAKIMSKMGYKAGLGLGKDQQGISVPLEVEKSGVNVGRILPVSEIKIKEEKPSDVMVDPSKVPTRILLLQNMVRPGEVDNDLEAETKEECKKYGDVVKCLIYEIPNKRVPDDEAVRIFVEFKHVESAVKAVNDLNGRYFGGRIVRASFYNLDRFNRYNLGP